MSLPKQNRRAWLAFTLLPLLGHAEATLEEVVVSATRLREQAQVDVPASVTVLDSQTLTDSAQQHFEEVLAQVPNLNWAAGSSRPRYFQLRGIGEREQYEGAPNSSVGFLIDDIDFSGIGMAATLFDVDQVEVLRGPQGTRLGANALAGIVAIRGAEPEDEFSVSTLAEIGDYGTHSGGVMATGPMDSLDSAWRVAAQRYVSDGFRRNAFLSRDDTNDRDETTARAKWRWQASDSAQLDLTYLYADLANGYDAFSIDNSRVTLSDDPGEDSQRVHAGAAKWRNRFASGLELTGIVTALDSNSVHAFDGDWGNASSWAPYTYDFVYRADRDRRTTTQELRLASSSDNSFAWLAGVYASQLREDIGEVSRGLLIDPDPVFGYTFAVDEYLNSAFDADTVAAFAQLDGKFASRWRWSLGLRQETRDAQYEDAGNWGGDPNRLTRDNRRRDSMWGGNGSITFAMSQHANLYAGIARGYKAGGFNLGSARATQAEFEPEFLWNYELGVKSDAADGRVYVDIVLFYMDREDVQVRSGRQLVPGDPNSFVFFTANAANGKNYGVESSIRWLPIDALELGGSLGLLRTNVVGLIDGDGNALPEREQAHAPNYQAQLNATWRGWGGWMMRIDAFAQDNYYFDIDHNQQSVPYGLLHFKLGYEAEHWSVHGWVRNVFDEAYATRGFFFGNEPPDFADKLYVQNGEPRTVGISARWSLR